MKKLTTIHILSVDSSLKLYGFIALWVIGTVLPSWSQPQQELITVQVTPTQADWTYELGDQADFDIQILQNGHPLTDVSIQYQIGLEQMPPEKTGELSLDGGQTILEGIALDEPGFLRCEVSVTYEDKTYRGWGTAGFAPAQIQPTVEMPTDFDTFWEQAKQKLAELPLDAHMTHMPELSTADIDVYHVNLQNIQMPHSWKGTSRFYGMLSVPKKSGTYPAILNVPGAGVRAYGRDDRAAKGVIVFKVGIHGIPVNLPDELYQSLVTGALSGYPHYKLENKDHYYYKRVYMGCVRAIDFIFSLTQFDGENLAVTGGSQGGALSIITAGLDDRVKYLAAFYPALSDMTGYLEGRAGGWPHMFKDFDTEKYPNWVETAAYYDVVNFARKLNIPGWYAWGYNDNVCPPTSMYAAYNVITAPKELHTYLETAHWTYPEEREAANTWLYSQLKILE